MTRLRALVLVGVVIALAATSAASGQATQPVLRRPNPLFVSIGLDYVNPITLPDGSFVTAIDPVTHPVIPSSVKDLRFLEYDKRDDLGGFIPAPKGWLALGTCRPEVNLGDDPCPGVNLGKGLLGPSGISLYSHNQVNGRINSYTWLHGLGGGGGTCAACGLVGPPGLFPSTSPLPGPNQGYGGQTTPPKQPTPPPTPPVSTGDAGDCGTKGISIVSNLPKRTVAGHPVNACQIYVVNQAPGDGTFEKMKITNTTNIPYTLSLKATGTPNRLWQDLEMGIWVKGQAAPTPLPPLHFWTAQYNKIQVLQPGQVVHYLIELYLPLSAGNEDQNLPAIIDFNWRAIEKTSG